MAEFCETRQKGGLQWWVTAKPGTAGYCEQGKIAVSSGELRRNHGQQQAPVEGYSETRDNCGLQLWVTAKPGTIAGLHWRVTTKTRGNVGLKWWVTAKPGTMAGFRGGLLRNQGQMQVSGAGYCETRDNSGLNWRVSANQRQWQAPVAGYCEPRDNGRLQCRVTAKPGIIADSIGGLLRNQGQRRVTAK